MKDIFKNFNYKDDNIKKQKKLFLEYFKIMESLYFEDNFYSYYFKDWIQSKIYTKKDIYLISKFDEIKINEYDVKIMEWYKNIWRDISKSFSFKINYKIIDSNKHIRFLLFLLDIKLKKKKKTIISLEELYYLLELDYNPKYISKLLKNFFLKWDEIKKIFPKIDIKLFSKTDLLIELKI